MAGFRLLFIEFLGVHADLLVVELVRSELALSKIFSRSRSYVPTKFEVLLLDA